LGSKKIGATTRAARRLRPFTGSPGRTASPVAPALGPCPGARSGFAWVTCTTSPILERPASSKASAIGRPSASLLTLAVTSPIDWH